MKKTLLMYWPKGGNVEFSAKLIAEKCHEVKIEPIDEVTLQDVKDHGNIIIGCSTVGASTWESSENEEPWTRMMSELEKIDIKDKTFAIFGLGDQVRWPHHFVDGMAIVHEKVTKIGGKIIGAWPVKGYDFMESESQNGDYFCGLALDQDQQSEKTEGRIEKWVAQIRKEFQK